MRACPSCRCLSPARARAAELPIFDAHVHYSHDAWDNLPPKEAIAILRRAGIKRALVSSSGDEGTQRLVAEAPDLVLPSLRPYRTRGDIATWVRDESVSTFLEDRLARQRYVAIGEFHLYGADADLPVARRMVTRRQQSPLHAHSDPDAIERLFRQDPAARAFWARTRGSLQRPEPRPRDARRARTLVDLAFRSEPGGRRQGARQEWRAVHGARITMVGTLQRDTEAVALHVEHAGCVVPRLAPRRRSFRSRRAERMPTATPTRCWSRDVRSQPMSAAGPPPQGTPPVSP